MRVSWRAKESDIGSSWSYLRPPFTHKNAASEGFVARKNIIFYCATKCRVRAFLIVRDHIERGNLKLKEARLLRRLQNGESAALGEIMELYTPYVAAIVRNIIDPPLQEEDVEEVVADVFLSLWKNAADIEDGLLFRLHSFNISGKVCVVVLSSTTSVGALKADNFGNFVAVGIVAV